MGDVGTDEFLRRAHAHRQVLDRQLGELRAAATEGQRLAGDAQTAANAAREELSRAYLPGFDAMSLAVAERLAGLPTGWAAGRLQAVQEEDRRLVSRVSEIERDEGFSMRQVYAGDGGEWTNDLKRAEGALRPARDEEARYLAIPYFRELISAGYDTPEYSVPWYSLSYYTYWKHADEACEAFGVEPFGRVREQWLELQPRLATLARRCDEAKLRLRFLEGLIAEHAAALARREALRGTAPLDEARDALETHLETADLRALGGTAQSAGRQDLAQHLVRQDGLDAKARYLLGLCSDHELEGVIQAERTKLDQDIAKFSRPKKAGTRFAQDALEKRFAARPARLDQRIQQRRDLQQRIYGYHDYDDWDEHGTPYWDSWSSGTPWWFHMSGRRQIDDGARRFSDVSTFADQHPGWTFEKPARDLPAESDDPMDAAAAALASERSGPETRDVS